MLKRTGPNSVTSDSGYSMGFGRELIKYKEGDHRMYIDSPMGLTYDKTIFIEVNSINRWLPPYENEPVSLDKHDKILSRVKEMILFLGYKYQIR